LSQFLIAYDERKPNYDYAELYRKLEAGGAKHIQESVWAMSSPQTAQKLFNAIQPCLPEGAKLLVVEITADAVSIGDLEQWSDIF
jgi:CRISPR/Cas system-associated endoribonuclease Cas2